MTAYDFKKTLSFLRKMEQTMTKETFILIFGQKGYYLWDEFRNFSFSLTVLIQCLKEDEANKLLLYLASQFQIA